MRFQLWEKGTKTPALQKWFALCGFISVAIFGTGIWIGITEPHFIPYPDKTFTSVVAMLVAVFLALPFACQFFFKRWRRHPRFTIFLELNIYLIIALGSLGTFSWYALWPSYDTVLHGFVALQTALLCGVTYYVLTLKSPALSKIFMVAIIGSFVVLLIWEGLEILVEYWSGLDIFLTQGELDDFSKDMWANIIGALFGGFCAVGVVPRWGRRLKNTD